MKISFRTAVLTLLLLCISILEAGGQSRSGPHLVFRWAFVRLESRGQRRAMDFSTLPTVRAGDRLQVCIEPTTPMHLYLFLLDSRRDLALLYPSALPSHPASGGEGMTLPLEGQWFTIDERTGEEQFYLLASSVRLSRLEDLTAAWLKKPASAEARALVLEEIKQLRRRHSALTAPVEKAVPMAGTFQSRSLADEIAGDAIAVEAAEFYARTLRLHHE